jgi:hypothetical protein
MGRPSERPVAAAVELPKRRESEQLLDPDAPRSSQEEPSACASQKAAPVDGARVTNIVIVLYLHWQVPLYQGNPRSTFVHFDCTRCGLCCASR